LNTVEPVESTVRAADPALLPLTPAAGPSLVAVALIALLASVASVGVYHAAVVSTQTRLAIVDLPAVYREREAAFEKLLTRGTRGTRETRETRETLGGAVTRDRDEAMAMAGDFARRLPKALDELAAECGCTVLTSNAVAGRHRLPDLTAALRAKVGP
jgi:hypothetical protein